MAVKFWESVGIGSQRCYCMSTSLSSCFGSLLCPEFAKGIRVGSSNTDARRQLLFASSHTKRVSAGLPAAARPKCASSVSAGLSAAWMSTPSIVLLTERFRSDSNNSVSYQIILRLNRKEQQQQQQTTSTTAATATVIITRRFTRKNKTT